MVPVGPGDQSGGDPAPIVGRFRSLPVAADRNRDAAVVDIVDMGVAGGGPGDGAGVRVPVGTIGKGGDEVGEEGPEVAAVGIRAGALEPAAELSSVTVGELVDEVVGEAALRGFLPALFIGEGLDIAGADILPDQELEAHEVLEDDADAPVQRTVWRDDCDQNPVRGQQGTWTLPRAGWCPGDMVQPWIEDITALATPGSSSEVRYAVADYENSCRPDAPVCTGCALGTGCDYDGGNHTPPEVQVSAAAVIYEAAR